MKDTEVKKEILKKLMAEMDGRVVESDLKPKTKMVIKAEGKSPEDVKNKVIDKLKTLPVPSEEELKSEMAGETEPADEELGPLETAKKGMTCCPECGEMYKECGCEDMGQGEDQEESSEDVASVLPEKMKKALLERLLASK